MRPCTRRSQADREDSHKAIPTSGIEIGKGKDVTTYTKETHDDFNACALNNNLRPMPFSSAGGAAQRRSDRVKRS